MTATELLNIYFYYPITIYNPFFIHWLFLSTRFVLSNITNMTFDETDFAFKGLYTNDAPENFTYKTAPKTVASGPTYKPYTPSKHSPVQTPVEHAPVNVQRRMFSNVEIHQRAHAIPIYMTDISFKQYFARVDRNVFKFRLKASLTWAFTAAAFVLWVARPSKQWFDTRVRGLKE
jgi:hypothetical protein